MELTNFVLKNCCYTVDYVKHVTNNNMSSERIPSSCWSGDLDQKIVCFGFHNICTTMFKNI